ncbi:unnamed protein product [Leptosia nina]|uniref:Uncharacterized protein n=1 Tax=Leptosia nina TaxID=320188 RepID=A0AAV1JLK4_9NEOP
MCIRFEINGARGTKIARRSTRPPAFTFGAELASGLRTRRTFSALVNARSGYYDTAIQRAAPVIRPRRYQAISYRLGSCRARRQTRDAAARARRIDVYFVR